MEKLNVKNYIKYDNENKEVQFDIIGQIGNAYSENYPAPTAAALMPFFREAAEMGGEDGKIIVNIYSPGGDLLDAIAIYDLLKAEKIKFEARCYGMVGSAATILSCASPNAFIGENSVYFLHNPYNAGKGQSDEITAEIEKHADRMAEIYSAKTGGKTNKREIKKLMKAGDKNVTLSAKEALNYGFVDGILKTNYKAEFIRLQAAYNPQTSPGGEKPSGYSQNKKKLNMSWLMDFFRKGGADEKEAAEMEAKFKAEAKAKAEKEAAEKEKAEKEAAEKEKAEKEAAELEKELEAAEKELERQKAEHEKNVSAKLAEITAKVEKLEAENNELKLLATKGNFSGTENSGANPFKDKGENNSGAVTKEMLPKAEANTTYNKKITLI